jgi:hypothetical protein
MDAADHRNMLARYSRNLFLNVFCGLERKAIKYNTRYEKIAAEGI